MPSVTIISKVVVSIPAYGENVSGVVPYGLTYHVIETLTFGTFLFAMQTNHLYTELIYIYLFIRHGVNGF
jgi:hypothetical protein